MQEKQDQLVRALPLKEEDERQGVDDPAYK
jgi:hypothetical protein